MRKWWLAVGRPEHWRIAFEYGNIWGLRETARQLALWESLSQGDHVLFYATSPISGVIGYGKVRTKFRQDKPLWPQEVRDGEVIWPYRFEFDVEYCLPHDKWKNQRAVSDALKTIARGGFQIVDGKVADELVGAFARPPAVPEIVEGEREGVSLHDEIKTKLLKVGRLQGFIAESEYNMDGGKLDVVWRRVQKSVPTYVFEVQIGGDLYHAVGKLKHAFDIWNSNIFLVIREGDAPKARELLAGTFHEVQDRVKLVVAGEVGELLRRKKAYRDFEAELGIL